MKQSLQQFFCQVDSGVDAVQRLIRPFSESLGLTGFAYVRIYNEGRVSWVTNVPDHDRLLVESGALNEDSFVDTQVALKEGSYLWFHDRNFPGSETFYREREQRFKIDHGFVVVQHTKDYVETCCFSACLAKRPLYNLFMSRRGLFKAFMDHFKSQLSRDLLTILNEGFALCEIKKSYGVPSQDDACQTLAVYCGAASLLALSKRERECLTLLREGLTYEGIGLRLFLSSRTIEHYLTSVKNKLGLETHYELCQAAHRLAELGLSPVLQNGPSLLPLKAKRR